MGMQAAASGVARRQTAAAAAAAAAASQNQQLPQPLPLPLQEGNGASQHAKVPSEPAQQQQQQTSGSSEEEQEREDYQGPDYEGGAAAAAPLPRASDWGMRPRVDPSTYRRADGGWQPDYLIGGNDDEFGRPHQKNRRAREAIHHRLRAYVDSRRYATRVGKIVASNLTGVLIPAGGSRLITNLIITLKVLREHHKCKLPVEVMWQGEKEMDAVSWAAIEKSFAPIRGVDILKEKYPTQKLHFKKLELKSYTGKVFSLLVSRFRHVLMVDADCMPVQSPEQLLAHPQYRAAGNLFWPDAWQGTVYSGAYEMHGLAEKAQEIIDHGKGRNPRDTESGQLLIDRGKHLDVLEYLLWINSFPEDHDGLAHLWGDKDTFGIAFAVAGKADAFSQVDVPPAGIFSWRKDMLLIKETYERTWGWQLLGFLQMDSWGRPAFIHRTINKFTLQDAPWAMELITAPMPTRWAAYYLSQDAVGPTTGVPYDYVVPASSVTELAPTQTAMGLSDLIVVEPALSSGSPSSSSSPAPSTCPVPTFLSVWAMKESGLAIDLDPGLQRNCSRTLRRLLGTDVYTTYRQNGWLEAPALRYLDTAHLSGQPSDWTAQKAEAETPLPAWRPDFDNPAFDGPFARAVRAAYAAHRWLLEHKGAFPILESVPSPPPEHID